ncbi:hypothetical protein FisN_3Lh601 [Fistulifera solaris]|uniref:Uncharacterized protein n=1 Tax=Fistulifera solaris TaxID=1519565 RepID=A0A1Z5J8Q7_FISSO|nr:hypothetical protein FisN_3Lh601 [Fistulifera solaris]|eukprot:GAX10383.1 hypothetical protein FisN_3Lh601 [Fistulifera solaris]
MDVCTFELRPHDGKSKRSHVYLSRTIAVFSLRSSLAATTDMIRHSLFALPRELLSLLTLLLLRRAAFVQAKFSCSAPQSITAPFSYTPSSVEPVNDNEISFNVCGDAREEGSSVLPPGLWFRYVTSKTTIVRVYEEAVKQYLFSVDTLVFSGSCDDSLECEDYSMSISDDLVFQADVDVEYFIFAFSDANISDPFTLYVEELNFPVNDELHNAAVLTQDDLPFQGEFTTVGALSDTALDACGLDGEYGVWFNYSTIYSQQALALRANTGNTRDVLGIQAWIDDQMVCITSGNTWDSTIEWTAEAGVEYSILVAEPPNSYGQSFTFTLESQSIVHAQPTAAVVEPITSTPVIVVDDGPTAAATFKPTISTNDELETISPSVVQNNSFDPEPTITSSNAGKLKKGITLAWGLVFAILLF